MKVIGSKLPSYIIDSSVLISHLLPDEKVPRTLQPIINQFLQNKALFTAPTILSYEIGNNLKSSVLRNRLDPTSAMKLAKLFLQLDIHYQTPDLPKTLKLSVKHNLSFYDASYIYLNHSLKLPLLSLDKHLVKLSQPVR